MQELLSTVVATEFVYVATLWIAGRLYYLKSQRNTFVLESLSLPPCEKARMGKSRKMLRRLVKKLTVMLRSKHLKKNKAITHGYAVEQNPLSLGDPRSWTPKPCECCSLARSCEAGVEIAVAMPTPTLANCTIPMNQDSESGLYACSDLEGSFGPEERCHSYCSKGDACSACPVEDCCISASEVSLEKVVAGAEEETVYSAYWHGSVMVHMRECVDQTALQELISEVKTLSHIRHENIQLFLGVCLDLHPDYVGIVMDQTKGDTLHTLLHRQGHKFNFQSLTKILSQIAQGMEYLHAKGISHPLLSSRCVSIHYRACISMLTPCALSGLVEGDELVYLPPEAMRTLYLENGRLFRTYYLEEQNFAANMFSFGSIVYEMVTMEKPFKGVPVHSVVWQVSNGRTQPLDRLQEGKFREVVQSCWHQDPRERPSFQEFLDTVEQNTSPRAYGLKSYFSFSEPSQLAKLGL